LILKPYHRTAGSFEPILTYLVFYMGQVRRD
jgi:hypothetical protein